MDLKGWACTRPCNGGPRAGGLGAPGAAPDPARRSPWPSPSQSLGQDTRAKQRCPGSVHSARSRAAPPSSRPAAGPARAPAQVKWGVQPTAGRSDPASGVTDTTSDQGSVTPGDGDKAQSTPRSARTRQTHPQEGPRAVLAEMTAALAPLSTLLPDGAIAMPAPAPPHGTQLGSLGSSPITSHGPPENQALPAPPNRAPGPGPDGVCFVSRWH